MTETQWRFLKAIAERVPGDRIVELRLFPTIRQGGAESGVAVVAVEELALEPIGGELDAAAGETMDSGRDAADAADATDVATMESSDTSEDVGAGDETAEMPADQLAVTEEMTWGAPPELEDTAHSAADRHHSIPAPIGSPQADPASSHAPDVEVPLTGQLGTTAASAASPLPRLGGEDADPTDLAERQVTPAMADSSQFPTVADVVNPAAPDLAATSEAAPRIVAEQEVALAVDLDDGELEPAEGEPMPSLDDILDLAAASAANESVIQAAARQSPKRYAVLAARYRLTLKGPERGKWDFEITHEADAPLDTVERVARGVARRAGDAGDPESFSAPQLRSTLAQPWWNSAT